MTIHRIVAALVLSIAVRQGVFAAVIAVDTSAGALQRAIEQTRSQHATLRLKSGTYALDHAISLSAADSGTTIEAAAGEKVVFSGGKRISGWHNAKFNGRECWAADVPAVKEGRWFFRQLWIDNKLATRARQPNRGFLRVKESPDAGPEWNRGQHRFRFNDDDVPAGPFSFAAEAIVCSRWVESRLPIALVDPAQHLATLLRHSHWRIEPNDPYWLEGDARWFDQPGEWFLDRAGGAMYYLPMPGQQIEHIDAIAPVTTTLVELNGAQNVAIRGITFSHTQWMLPEPRATTVPTTRPNDDGGFDQAALPVPAAVRGDHLRDCTFEDCAFEHLGTWAIDLGPSAQNCRVSHCTFDDLGAGGIKIGDASIPKAPADQSSANVIADCTIANCGRVFPSAVGVWIGQSAGNRIEHNDIHDLYYSGISAGWSWGYGDSLNRDNVIEQNHIHHIGQLTDGDGPILSDMGAIYLLGARKGTVIRDNLIHDIAAVKYGGWGVYLDEGSSDVITENNIIYRTTHGGFHLHYGANNIVRNNIFAFGGEVQVARTREEDHLSFTFERNIVYWTSGALTRSSPVQVKFDHNLYGPIAEQDFRAGDKTWEQWRAAGEDEGTIFRDVKFVDPKRGDFQLASEETAKRIGFKAIDLSHAGRR